MSSLRKSLMGGNPVTLEGPELQVGMKSPEFIVRDTGLNPVSLLNFTGKVILISVVPSLDTGVCDAQTRRFNQEGNDLGDQVDILTISMDLPFAQARWCGAAGIDRVTTLSDYYNGSFGLAYGVLIKELRLLNRSIFVLDENRTIRYLEIVPENHNHPDYTKALDVVKKLLAE